MERSNFLLAAFLAITLGTAALAEPISVRHIQRPMHRFMVARSEAGKIIASGEFSQVVQGDEVTMRLTYRFVDGSIDDETTTYTAAGHVSVSAQPSHTERAVLCEADRLCGGSRYRHSDQPHSDKNGKIHVESEHMDLPDDLANGFVGTLLLNVPHNTTPFRVGILAPVGGGRLIRLLISPEGEQPFHDGRTDP